jgi:hypothetical protein
MRALEELMTLVPRLDPHQQHECYENGSGTQRQGITTPKGPSDSCDIRVIDMCVPKDVEKAL